MIGMNLKTLIWGQFHKGPSFVIYQVYIFTVRIILTNFTTYVKILCNLRHFYNDLDRRCKIS